MFCIFKVKHGSKLKEVFVFQTLTFVMGKNEGASVLKD